jgi:hypothetical protein
LHFLLAPLAHMRATSSFGLAAGEGATTGAAPPGGGKAVAAAVAGAAMTAGAAGAAPGAGAETEPFSGTVQPTAMFTVLPALSRVTPSTVIFEIVAPAILSCTGKTWLNSDREPEKNASALSLVSNVPVSAT